MDVSGGGDRRENCGPAGRPLKRRRRRGESLTSSTRAGKFETRHLVSYRAIVLDFRVMMGGVGAEQPSPEGGTRGETAGGDFAEVTVQLPPGAHPEIEIHENSGKE